MTTKKLRGLALAVGLFIAACASTPSSTPTPVASVAASPARVTGLEVLKIAGASPEVRVVVSGQLADACHRLQSAEVQKAGQIFAITLPTIRAADANCPAGAVDFERVVTLDLTDSSPGSYTVTAGDQRASFDLTASTTGDSQPQPAATVPPPAAPASNPTAAPTAAPTQAPATTGTSAARDCLDKAAFFGDVSIPDDTAFKQGETFVKTWKFRNEGTCTWDKGYNLVFAGGDAMSGPQSQPIDQVIKPNDIFELSVKLTAPTGGGSHAGNWQFQNPEGKFFGVGVKGADFFWVKIVVNYFTGQTLETSQGAASTSTTRGGCAVQRNGDFENQVLTLINNARAANGLAPLTLQAPLSAAAFVHSQDMACNNFVDHTGSDGSTWNMRIKAQGYSAANARENIYVGSPDFGGTPAGAFEWWMNSTIHRGNILSAESSSIGIGYAFRAGSEYGGYFTIVFARP
jgi:uncharacterized protein YkwD